MKNIAFYILSLFLLHSLPVAAQLDSINHLDEVVLNDIKLFRNSVGQEVTVLNDSTIAENEPLLSSLLKFNSPIYFKENGNGMVASASFRGTTASQTAVVWNGININSVFNGQTDFNTITTTSFDNVAVRPGGGSVLYGSGAIGGSVHLNNKFRFGGGFRNRLRLEYGSFNTFSAAYKGGYSSEETNVQLSVSRLTSDNDYPYLGTEKRNENGDFYHTNISLGLAHLLDNRNSLKFYSNYSDGERAFSGTLTAPSKSKYSDENFRGLIEWQGFYGQFTSSLKLAYLNENYRFYENRYREDYDFGSAKTGIAKYDLKYRITSEITVNGILEYEHTNGEGSNVGGNDRNIGAFALLFSHELGRLSYELSGRKEISDRYESPLLFSVAAGYDVASNYHLRLNFSRNFRIPTYNDLFWRAGGNLELKPEKSLQAEVGQEVRLGKFTFGLTGYVIKVKNLLRWVPNESGLWSPVNTESVKNHGLEVDLLWERSFDQHHFQLLGLYAFTKSRDENLDKELIYVPKHKSTASMAYSYGPFSMNYQFLYNGKIFTSTDNRYDLSGYTVSNLGADYRIGKNDLVKIGVEVQNLFNKSYESLPSRPMPGRSINSSLTINF